MCAYAISTKISLITMNVRVQSGGQGVRTPPPPPEKLQKIGFVSNPGPDPQKNYEATQPAFNVGPSSARQRNAILMAFRWRADDGPPVLVFRSSHHSSTRKKKLSKISGSAHAMHNYLDRCEQCTTVRLYSPDYKV